MMADRKDGPFREWAPPDSFRPSLQAVLGGQRSTAGPAVETGQGQQEGMMRYGFSNYPSFFDTNMGARAYLGMG